MVASLATMTHSRPEMRPTPVMMLAGMHVAAIEAVGGERRQFEEGGAGIDQQVDALARQHLAARGMPLARRLAAAARDHLELVAQVGHQRRASRRRCGRIRRIWDRWWNEAAWSASLLSWSRGDSFRTGWNLFLERDSLYHLAPNVKFRRSSRTTPARSACGGFRWCRRRSRRVWRRAAAGRSDSR